VERGGCAWRRRRNQAERTRVNPYRGVRVSSTRIMLAASGVCAACLCGCGGCGDVAIRRPGAARQRVAACAVSTAGGCCACAATSIRRSGVWPFVPATRLCAAYHAKRTSDRNAGIRETAVRSAKRGVWQNWRRAVPRCARRVAPWRLLTARLRAAAAAETQAACIAAAAQNINRHRHKRARDGNSMPSSTRINRGKQCVRRKIERVKRR